MKIKSPVDEFISLKFRAQRAGLILTLVGLAACPAHSCFFILRRIR